MDLKECQENGRLNLSGFIDINKSAIPYSDFIELYVKSGKYEVYTEKSIAEFQKSISNELVKSNMGADELKRANHELSTLKRIEYQLNDTIIGVYVKENVEKSVDDDLEKGMITESFGSYSNNKLSFNKTGKQIKTQIETVLLPLLNAQKVNLEAQLAVCCKDLANDPDDYVSSYEYRGFQNVLPKVGRYSWDMIDGRINGANGTSCTDEEKQCMRKYNETASFIVSTMADIQYSSILARNVEETKSYELTSDQILALQF